MNKISFPYLSCKYLSFSNLEMINLGRKMGADSNLGLLLFNEIPTGICHHTTYYQKDSWISLFFWVQLFSTWNQSSTTWTCLWKNAIWMKTFMFNHNTLCWSQQLIDHVMYGFMWPQCLHFLGWGYSSIFGKCKN